jgi:transposase
MAGFTGLGDGGPGGLMHPGHQIGAVYLHCEPVDFRKQINGLAAIVEAELAVSPFGDALFVFINRRRTRIKALYWHRNGFCLWQKRLEADRFAWPKAATIDATCAVSLRELEWLLEGFDLWHNKPHKTLNYMASC